MSTITADRTRDFVSSVATMLSEFSEGWIVPGVPFPIQMDPAKTATGVHLLGPDDGEFVSLMVSDPLIARLSGAYAAEVDPKAVLEELAELTADLVSSRLHLDLPLSVITRGGQTLSDPIQEPAQTWTRGPGLDLAIPLQGEGDESLLVISTVQFSI